MLRQNFKFKYPISKLVSHCKGKAEHHRAREKHYREKFVEAEKDLRENGIKMEEQQGSRVIGSGAVSSLTSYGSNNTYGGKVLVPTFDPDKVRVVEECKTKISEHQVKADQQEKYLHTFQAASTVDPEMVIKIDADDVEFFGLES